MPGTCAVHAGRPAARAFGLRGYCAECVRGLETTVRAAPIQIQPRDCFAIARGGGFAVPPGSPAAHWLAHELAVLGRPNRSVCAAGFALELADLLATRRELERTLPQTRDVWVDLDGEACGLVTEVRREEGSELALTVRGLLGPGGRLEVLDFYRDLHGRGRFFR